MLSFKYSEYFKDTKIYKPVELRRIMQKQNLDLVTLYAKAVVLANKRHDGQIRKVSGEPYFMHPLRVSERVGMMFKEHKDIEILRIVAILHDLLEDTETTDKELLKLFGEKITTLVKGLSENKKLPTRNDAHKEFLGRLKTSVDSIKLIKLCDIQDNLDTIDGNVSWKGFLQRSKEILENMSVIDEDNKRIFEVQKKSTLNKINQELQKRVV